MSWWRGGTKRMMKLVVAYGTRVQAEINLKLGVSYHIIVVN